MAVRRAIEEEWERCAFQLRHCPGRAVGIKPLSFVLVSEWSQAKGHDVDGDVVRAWIRDAGGLRAVAKQEFKRLSSLDWLEEPRHASVLFHVCDDGRHVVYVVSPGPLAGHGGKCWIDPADPRLSSFSWIS